MKRFYKDVSVGEAGGGWQVLLDGRGIRTAGKRPQVVTTRALSEAMAEEWAGQAETIDPGAFALRDLADYAIDVVAPAREEAVASLIPFAETDTLCYRGEEGEPLLARQTELWEPLLQAAEHRWDLSFSRVAGVIHRPQPPETVARLQAILSAESDFSLAALRTIAGLSASLVIALAAVRPEADPQGLWNAANLEEDWQAQLWGRDAEAEARREKRFEAFRSAMRFALLAGA